MQPMPQQMQPMQLMNTIPNYMNYPYGLNSASVPAVYAASVPPPAQVYSTNIPGAPPTISIETDPYAMNQFMTPQAPKPRRTLTLKRSQGQPSIRQEGEPGIRQEGGSGNVKITVIKGT